MQTTSIAAGKGWRVNRYLCSAGPTDRPFEERHDCVSVSLVARGSFEYRAAGGAAMLVPGALLLGNFGECYRCGHDHSTGDECVSFQFEPALWEDLVATTPGARRASFERSVHPPDWTLVPMLAEAETVCEKTATLDAEEVALQLASTVILRVADATGKTERAVTRRERSKILEAVRQIAALAEDQPDDALSLGTLAREAGMSRFHFLRLFRRVVGMTPHQFVLRQRMRRAAVQLRCSAGTVAAVALNAGFSDLSTFNRQFRRVFGMPPASFRKDGGATSNVLSDQVD